MIRDQAEVEDVVQESFIKAYRALPNFRGDSAFYTWLYRIGINTAKNYLVSLGDSHDRGIFVWRWQDEKKMCQNKLSKPVLTQALSDE